MTGPQGKKIIAVVGMPGSGKSTVVQTLVSHCQLPSIHFGNLTIEELRRRNWPQNEENEKKIRQELRQEHGMGAYAYLLLPKIKEMLLKSERILIDGLYSWQEYLLLKRANLADLLLLLVISRRNNRYRRLAIRNCRPLTAVEAEKRDIAEIEVLEKGGPIALCDYYLTNDGTIKQLCQAVHDLAQELSID